MIIYQLKLNRDLRDCLGILKENMIVWYKNKVMILNNKYRVSTKDAYPLLNIFAASFPNELFT